MISSLRLERRVEWLLSRRTILPQLLLLLEEMTSSLRLERRVERLLLRKIILPLPPLLELVEMTS